MSKALLGLTRTSDGIGNRRWIAHKIILGTVRRRRVYIIFCRLAWLGKSEESDSRYITLLLRLYGNSNNIFLRDKWHIEISMIAVQGRWRLAACEIQHPGHLNEARKKGFSMYIKLWQNTPEGWNGSGTVRQHSIACRSSFEMVFETRPRQCHFQDHGFQQHNEISTVLRPPQTANFHVNHPPSEDSPSRSSPHTPSESRPRP